MNRIEPPKPSPLLMVLSLPNILLPDKRYSTPSEKNHKPLGRLGMELQGQKARIGG